MTGDQLVRKFVLFTDADVEMFMAFMRANRRPMAEQQRFLQVVVSEYKESRTNEQNAFMWAGLLEPIAEQAYVGGVRYKAEMWHEFFKEMFLPETNAKGMDKWYYIPDPKVASLLQAPPSQERRLMMGTSNLNTAEMADYLNKIAEYAVHDLGVKLPANPREFP